MRVAKTQRRVACRSNVVLTSSVAGCLSPAKFQESGAGLHGFVGRSFSSWLVLRISSPPVGSRRARSKTPWPRTVPALSPATLLNAFAVASSAPRFRIWTCRMQRVVLCGYAPRPIGGLRRPCLVVVLIVRKLFSSLCGVLLLLALLQQSGVLFGMAGSRAGACLA